MKSYKSRLEVFETEMFEELCKVHRYNISSMARELELSRNTVQKKFSRYLHKKTFPDVFQSKT